MHEIKNKQETICFLPQKCWLSYQGPCKNHVDHFFRLFCPLPLRGQFYLIGFSSKVDITPTPLPHGCPHGFCMTPIPNMWENFVQHIFWNISSSISLLVLKSDSHAFISLHIHILPHIVNVRENTIKVPVNIVVPAFVAWSLSSMKCKVFYFSGY